MHGFNYPSQEFGRHTDFLSVPNVPPVVCVVLHIPWTLWDQKVVFGQSFATWGRKQDRSCSIYSNLGAWWYLSLFHIIQLSLQQVNRINPKRFQPSALSLGHKH